MYYKDNYNTKFVIFQDNEHYSELIHNNAKIIVYLNIDINKLQII